MNIEQESWDELNVYEVHGHTVVAYKNPKQDNRFALFMVVCLLTFPVSLPLLYIPKVGNWIMDRAIRWIESE